jgi:tripartite-type tricarboxylate transporter receptor subunit TctC
VTSRLTALLWGDACRLDLPSRHLSAAPDGYTLSSGDWSTHVVNGAIYTLQYDLLNDFEPIALLSSTPLLIVTKNAVPATNLRELLAWLKANQDKASYGTSGPGSPSHVSGLLLQKMTGMQFHFVPYRGGAVVLQDLIAGQIDVAFCRGVECSSGGARRQDQGLCRHQ